MIQLQVLNRILSTNDLSLVILNNLTSEYFSDYKQEFNFICDHSSQYGNVPDLATFLSVFPDFDVIEVTETSKYLIEELYRDFNKRKLAKVFNKVREYLNNNQTDDALACYLSASDEMREAVSLDAVDIIRDTSRYKAYIDRSKDFSKFYIKTGFDELDKIIGGWDRNDELATIVARSNVGKSWALLKCAVKAAECGYTVGIYSGEMSINKVAYRIDTLISHISNRGMTQGNTDIQVSYKKYLDNLSNMIPGSIKILTPAMINGPAGVNALRSFIEKEHLDMLCIDQHSLLEDDRKARNPVEKASNISKDLKNLQVLKRIPIIAVSQQNRTTPENGEVNLTQISQSDRIGQDSTTVIILEQDAGKLTLNLVKSRDAAAGKKLYYALDFDKGIYNYIPGEGDDNEVVQALEEEYEYVDEEAPF